jgi:MFS family permease
VIFRAALLNGIAGIVVDLYAPSLPQIAYDFNTTVMAAQATISTTVIGYALGQLFFGILCDWRGRKASIIIGLIIFALSSILAGFSPSIQVLLMARVIQGFAAGACQVVARAILVDLPKRGFCHGTDRRTILRSTYSAMAGLALELCGLCHL